MAAKSDGGGGSFYPKHEKAAFREKEAWHLRLISGMCFYFESLCKLTRCGKKKRKGYSVTERKEQDAVGVQLERGLAFRWER